MGERKAPSLIQKARRSRKSDILKVLFPGIRKSTNRKSGYKGKYNIRFFISNTFISKALLKWAKNQVKAKQAELSQFENY